MRAVETSDEDLVARAREGSSEAFEALYLRHREGVARTVFLLVGEPDAAQDATQDGFAIGWRDLRRLRDPARFRAWITGIALNRARRGRRRPEVAVADARPPVSESDPDAALSVRAALRRLPRPLLEVLVLRFYADLPEAEISSALGVPAGTVKSRLSRAKRRLAAALEVEDD